MSDDAERLTIAGLNAYWRNALDRASEDVDRQIAGTAMLLVAVQLIKAGMGAEGAAQYLAALSQAVAGGEMVSVTIGDVVLHLRDDGPPRQ